MVLEQILYVFWIKSLLVQIVFLDLTKAFDKVPHKRLMEKVAQHGIGGKLYKLIEGWLGDRKQSLHKRFCIELASGIKWGPTVLGPELFLIYINDLDEDIRNFILKFADLLMILKCLMDDKDKCKLPEDLNKLVSWAQKWKTEFNVTKCKVMHTGNKNNKFSYEMNGKVLDKGLVEKDLEIMISSDVKSSQQCVVACI